MNWVQGKNQNFTYSRTSFILTLDREATTDDDHSVLKSVGDSDVKSVLLNPGTNNVDQNESKKQTKKGFTAD